VANGEYEVVPSAVKLSRDVRNNDGVLEIPERISNATHDWL